MAEAKKNPLHSAPDSSINRAGSPPPDPDEDALADRAPATDEEPTIITKNKPAAPPDPPPSSDIRGRHLAHYELIEQIGAGGMAAVLRARDTQLDRFVALKILPPDLAQDQENIKRFHQEARAAARLDHENIARVFFCGEDQNLHFIAFEFVEGENLRAILERRGRLPVSEALTYMIQITAGLRHASERGVVHRDIKPSNIIITPDGRAKLVDMGLARSLEPQHDQGLTHSGVTLGTFDYISPEQALEPRDADVRSDIYSLGCTLYHMITGRPPVPEGTAARKLHHHQHVKPTDPRELVSGLPDEIVPVLARMMAKNPIDRYQSAQDLLNHLLATARKLGTTAGAPEGLLMVETDVPTPAPSFRPLLLGGLAVAAVVVLIFGLDLAGPPSAPTDRIARRNHPEEKDLGPNPREASLPSRLKDRQEIKPLPPQPPLRVARFEDEPSRLPEWLQENHDADQVEIVLAGGELEMALNKGEQMADRPGERAPEPGLVIQARQKVLLRARGEARPIIRLIYQGAPPRAQVGKPWTALTIDSPESRIEGIRLELNATCSKAPMTGLYFKGGKHEVRDCEIFQAQPSEDRLDRQMAGIIVESTGSPCSLKITDSLFVGYATLENNPPLGRSPHWLLGKEASPGQDAVIRKGAVELQVTNSAFGPHGSLFVLEKGDSSVPATVQLNHCTILAGNQSTVFDLEDRASANLSVNHCLISRPEEEVEGGECVLVRQKGTPDKVRYLGSDNRYHNLSDFWVSPEGGSEVGLKDFSSQLPLKNRGQDSSQLLKSNPWKKSSNPMGKLEEQQFLDAFVIDDQQRDLRLANDTDHAVGIAHHFLGKALPKLPPLPRKNQRIVDPSRETGNGIYSTLTEAVVGSKRGDVILIRHNGDLFVRPQRLEETGIDLTIKADEGFRPILILGEAPQADTALFWVHDGKLVLEGLELRLQPQRADFESQTLVAFLGDGHCTLRDCMITLEQQGHDTSLSVATLHDLDGLMKKAATSDNPPAAQSPQLVIDTCLIRGEGDLLICKSNRSFEATLNNLVAALKGSLLSLKPPAKATSAGQGQLSFQMSKVTTYLGGHLIHWKLDKEARNLSMPQCAATNCAFFPTSISNALVRLDIPEQEIERVRENLHLTGPNTCAYSTLFDHQSGSDMTMERLTQDRWRKFTETNNSRTKVMLATPPSSDTSFARLLPAQLKPADADGFGADLSSLLKLLPGENEGK